MKRFSLLISVLTALLILPVYAQDETVEIEFLIYCEGLECDVIESLITRFESENPSITVNLNVVDYAVIDTELPTMASEGDSPDLARITNFGIFRGQYLDVRPYLDEATAEFWDNNFPQAVLNAMRSDSDSQALHGFPDSLTISGPYINRTMFEQAAIDVPSDVLQRPTWDDWAAATGEVAEFWSTADSPVWGIVIDRSGHRIAGPAMSMGAELFDENGNFSIDSTGFQDMVTMLKNWHEQGIMAPDVWLDSGEGYVPAADYFIQNRAVMYMSGSWNLGRFAENTGIGFEWEAVPNPYGNYGSTGIAGGSAFVAYNTTEHPEAVAELMAYLIQTNVYGEYTARTLQLPAQFEVAEQTIPYQTTNSQLSAGLSTFSSEVSKLQDQAIALNVHPFAFAYYRNSANRISQVLTGELSIDEAIQALQEDIDLAVAEASN